MSIKEARDLKPSFDVPNAVGLWNSGGCCPRARQRPSPLARGDSCVGRQCPRAINRLANLRVLGRRELMSSRSIGIGRGPAVQVSLGALVLNAENHSWTKVMVACGLGAVEETSTSR